MANGALGGKLVGAGAGGFLLFYANDQDALRSCMVDEGLSEVRFSFDHDGSTLLTGTDPGAVPHPGRWPRDPDAARHRTVPKALLPVAGHPFADWQLRWLERQGVTEVVLSTGHLGSMVRDFVGDGRRWGLTVAYAEEGDRLRGTGGAVRLASALGLLDERFFVLYGDSYLPIDFSAVEQSFVAAGLPALMTVYDNSGRFDKSNAVLEGSRVVRYEKGLAEPPPEMHYIDYGLSVLERRVVDELVPAGSVADLATVYGTLAARGQMAAAVVTERFYEVGSTGGLADLEAHLSGHVP